jgi:acetyl-CoA synthetase
MTGPAGSSLGRAASYDQLRGTFRWRLPSRYNLGVDVTNRKDPKGEAVICTDGRRVTNKITFGELAESSNRLANAIAALGVGKGDRLGIILPQRAETAIAHIAAYKLGAIAVPLSILFGADALETRLGDADVAAVIGESEALEKVASLGLSARSVDVDRDWDALLSRASSRFDAAVTEPDTPALIIYTSGTTGPPKGALHGHRILSGHLPGVELSHDLFPQTGDVFWTPADWAWIGGLFDVLMPALHHGRPVVAFRAERFDPEQAFELIANLGVRNLFLPPTALRMMRQTRGARAEVRSVASGGESLNEDLIDWGRDRFGVTINEFYGQTEANMVISSCSALWPVRPGWMGKACPGHEVRIIDGEISIKAEGDPVVFLGYWNNPDATAEKVRAGWLRTGDLGETADDGSFRFIGRADDIISSGGYRIGPGEVEACLVEHPAVAMAAVIGVSDGVRGQIVKAFVVPTPGIQPSPRLTEDLQAFVKDQLATYEYPRELDFVDSLPMTTTGKIQRRILREREARLRGDAVNPP